jgi:single-stranded-DNA-specific exonuclease
MGNEALFGVTNSLLGREWRLRPAPAERVVQGLMQQYNLDDAVARILAARGLNQENSERFLNISLRDHLPDPMKFKDMPQAVERMIYAIKHDEPVVILCDYDCDGATSGALTYRYLTRMGLRVKFRVPERLREGYGGNTQTLDDIRAMMNSMGAGKGQGLCMMFDVNSRAHELIDYGNKLGFETIIGDHHKTEIELPKARAIINPMRFDENPGMPTELVSVGIAFMMMGALGKKLRDSGFFGPDRLKPEMRDYLDLVAVGTVADVGRLTGINRTLVARGLEVLGERKNPGLAQLMRVAGIDESVMPNEENIGFGIGPRINAAGRIDDTSIGIQLLCTDNTIEAAELAQKLGAINRTRQSINEKMMESARAMAQEQVARGAPVLVIADENWHPGVVGIVAGRVREEFYRPTFVFGHNPYHEAHMLVGSGRSVDGVDLGEAIIKGQLQGRFKGGGHAMAAGATIDGQRLREFQDYLANELDPEIKALPPRPILMCDQVVDATAVTLKTEENLRVIAPFGKDNPPITLVLNAIALQATKSLGDDGQHIKCIFTNAAGQKVEAVFWRAGEKPRIGELLSAPPATPFHVAGTVKRNDWQGQSRPQFVIEDMALA